MDIYGVLNHQHGGMYPVQKIEKQEIFQMNIAQGNITTEYYGDFYLNYSPLGYPNYKYTSVISNLIKDYTYYSAPASFSFVKSYNSVGEISTFMVCSHVIYNIYGSPPYEIILCFKTVPKSLKSIFYNNVQLPSGNKIIKTKSVPVSLIDSRLPNDKDYTFPVNYTRIRTCGVDDLPSNALGFLFTYIELNI